MLKLPSDFCKIGYRLYKIIPLPEDERKNDKTHGDYNYSDGVIRICLTDDDHMVANTLVHELNHAIYREWHLKKGDDEERVVDIMSNGLCTIWLDNNIWFKWIMGLLK